MLHHAFKARTNYTTGYKALKTHAPNLIQANTLARGGTHYNLYSNTHYTPHFTLHFISLCYFLFTYTCALLALTTPHRALLAHWDTLSLVTSLLLLTLTKWHEAHTYRCRNRSVVESVAGTGPRCPISCPSSRSVDTCRWMWGWWCELVLVDFSGNCEREREREQLLELVTWHFYCHVLGEEVLTNISPPQHWPSSYWSMSLVVWICLWAKLWWRCLPLVLWCYSTLAFIVFSFNEMKPNIML